MRLRVGGKGIATVKLEVEREHVLSSGAARVVPQSMSLPAEDEKWLKAELPPVITEDELRGDGEEAERYRRVAERA